jgi:hypothetical protein
VGNPRLPGWTPAPDAASYLVFLRALGRSSAATSMRRASRSTIPPARPGSVSAGSGGAGAALLDRAGQLGGAGPHYDSADAAIRRAFDLDPAYPPSRRLLASCHAKLGRTEAVRPAAAGRPRRTPHFAPFREQLGYALRYAGLFEGFHGELPPRTGAGRQPGTLVSTQDQITKSLIYLGDYRAALDSHETMESFLKALGRIPDEKEWFYRGVIQLYAGDTAAALNAFRRGEELDSASVWSAFGRGYAGIARRDRTAVASVLGDLERMEVVDGERHYRLVHLAAFLGGWTGRWSTWRCRSGRVLRCSLHRSDPLAASLHSHPGFPPILEVARQRHAAFASHFPADSYIDGSPGGSWNPVIRQHLRRRRHRLGSSPSIIYTWTDRRRHWRRTRFCL